MPEPSTVPSGRPGLSRRQTRVLLVVLAGLVAAASVPLVDVVRTARALSRGRAALTGGDPAMARAEFDRVLLSRPQDPEVHYLAAVAARRVGDIPEATRHLDAAAVGRWDQEAVRVEHALLAARAGEPFARVEPVLRAAVEAGRPETLEALAVLVPGYLAQFRLWEADALTAKWVGLTPDDATAWERRVDTLTRLGRTEPALAAHIRWVETAPDDRKARTDLVTRLVEAKRSPAEIHPHLDHLLAAAPDDPELLGLMAGCREAEGRADEAIALLDRVLAAPAPKAAPLAHRARLTLDHGRAEDALPYAKRAVGADPGLPIGWFTLARCLHQLGRTEEAAAAETKWREVVAELNRGTELGRQIAARPFDPDLRREMGELFLRSGREADGIRWLESALAIQPDHGPSRSVLADYYRRTNRPELAARHEASGRP